MSKKNNTLKRIAYDETPYFTQKEVDLIKRMIIICIKFRISEPLSINRMRMLYAKIQELS